MGYFKGDRRSGGRSTNSVDYFFVVNSASPDGHQEKREPAKVFMLEMVSPLGQDPSCARRFESEAKTFARVTPVGIDLIFKVRRFPQPDDSRSTFIVPDPDRCIDKRLKMFSFEITQRVRPLAKRPQSRPKAGPPAALPSAAASAAMADDSINFLRVNFIFFPFPKYRQKQC